MALKAKGGYGTLSQHGEGGADIRLSSMSQVHVDGDVEVRARAVYERKLQKDCRAMAR